MKKSTIYIVYMSLAILLVVVVYGLSLERKDKDVKDVVVAEQKSFSYNCEASSSAFDVLSNKFKVETEDSSIGKMVIGIEGMRPQKNEYWAFYIDGKTSKVGAESYTCNDQEKIKWKIEKF